MKARLIAAVGLLATIVLANYLTTEYGFVAVGFGLTATAGTYVAGLALGLRDVLQDKGDRRWVLGVLLLGAALSFLLAAPAIATASAVAFLVSEVVDWTVYTPLKRKAAAGTPRWSLAVATSNAAGAVVDTVIFVGIAFGTAAVSGALPGQLVGKAWATIAVIVPFALYRALRRR